MVGTQHERSGSLGLWISRAGMVVMAFAALWWFFYYAQHGGAFTYLHFKIHCLYGDAQECEAYRDFIGKRTVLPVYAPLVWWIGIAGFGIGTYMTRRQA